MSWLITIAGSAAASEGCPLIDPVREVSAISPYESETRYAESTRPVRRFVRAVLRAADHEPGAQRDECAIANLAHWARAGALLARPSNFEGGRQRIRYVFALNIAALKLGLTPTKDGEILAWLRSATVRVSADFARHRSVRGSADNLYVWSGAAAASYLLLANDPDLAAYQAAVWSDAIRAIDATGTVRLETSRGYHSLHYHTYFLSALLWLREFRARLGESTDEAAGSLGRLDRFIRHSVCSPGPAADGTPKRPAETLAAESLKVLDEPLWRGLRECGIKDTEIGPALMGGDMRATLVLLRNRQPLRRP